MWSAFSLPRFWTALPAKDAVTRIITGDRLEPGALNSVIEWNQVGYEWSVHRSDRARAESLIRLRVAENAIGRERPEEADRKARTASVKIRYSLTLNPVDSFLWLRLYTIETANTGFGAAELRYLIQSYVTAPREGWIALQRNKVALAAFPSLGKAMQENVTSEFVKMVDSNLTEAAALNVMGIGWDQRDRLLAGLTQIDIIPREALAKRLAREGLKVSVPGVETDERPWR